jgi:hypothetical protein
VESESGESGPGGPASSAVLVLPDASLGSGIDAGVHFFVTLFVRKVNVRKVNVRKVNVR